MQNADTTKNVSCMTCGQRWATVGESIGHACFNADQTDPAADITATEAAIFADLLAVEDRRYDARTSLAFAPSALPDTAWAGLKANYDAARTAAVEAFDAGFATIGNRMSRFGAYRILAAHAQQITASEDI